MSSAVGTQISFACMCGTAKMIVKSNRHKRRMCELLKEGRHGAINHMVLASRWSSEAVQTYGMTSCRNRRYG